MTRFDPLRLFAASSLDIALRSPSLRIPVAAAPASAAPPSGARSPPSARALVAARASLDPRHDLEIGLVTAWAGLALVSRAVREVWGRGRMGIERQQIDAMETTRMA